MVAAARALLNLLDRPAIYMRQLLRPCSAARLLGGEWLLMLRLWLMLLRLLLMLVLVAERAHRLRPLPLRRSVFFSARILYAKCIAKAAHRPEPRPR